MRILLFSAFGFFSLAANGGVPADFFEKNCTKCHGPEKQKGDLRLDTLQRPSLRDSDSELGDTWSLIADVIESGEMPPQKEARPSSETKQLAVASILDILSHAMRPAPGLRRLNRIEYENTVHDLLGTDTPLADLLPEDGSVQGFDNVTDGLGISSILMERYLEAADHAFEGVIRRIVPLPAATRRAVLMELKENISSVQGQKGGVIEREGAFVDFTAGWPPARMDAAFPIEPGIFRCRVAVFPHEPNTHRTLTVAVFTGPLFGDGKRHLQGIYDVTGTPENPRVIEFTTRMGAGDSIQVLPWIYPEHITYRDKHEPRPGVGILWAESHGPLDQSFPSESQKKLFGEAETISMKPGPSYYLRHRRGVRSQFVESSAPRVDAERIIRELVPRAFRRPVDGALADQFVAITLDQLDAGNTFEQAIRVGVAAVLCSPNFLLINREAKVDDYEIASRLSYFLWSSMPDDELMTLAAAGKLSDPQTRRAQVERMIGDPRVERFVENFTGQWLDLRDIEFTTPDKKLYPEFDDLLLHSMLSETRCFFRHLLANNLSVLNFVDSDFAILNQRLAEHYGIPGIRGHEEFRVVKLPEDSVRGGILSQGAILKVTANGTSTSPVLRGVWVLDNLMGQPPSPPPAGVPAVEPDIRGATTIRDQLAKHRSDESCNRCHARIDPPGFALEQFDAIGGERAWYRALSEKGEKVKNVSYRVGPTVERGGEWPDGRHFADFVEFRRQLMAERDLIARAIAEKLLVYGSGRPVTKADRASVEAIVEASRADDFGLRSMIHAVTETPLFLRP